MDLTNSSRGVLGRVLQPANIELNLRSNAREEVFLELIGKIPSLQKRPESRKLLFQALLDREKLYSTGLGNGIALPHTRNTIEGLGEEAIIVFGRHSQGLDYGAMDCTPVRLLFLLVAPTVNNHLQILARLTRVLRLPLLRQQLLEATAAEQVIRFIQEAEHKVCL